MWRQQRWGRRRRGIDAVGRHHPADVEHVHLGRIRDDVDDHPVERVGHRDVCEHRDGFARVRHGGHAG
jgi:hypothetical protein